MTLLNEFSDYNTDKKKKTRSCIWDPLLPPYIKVNFNVVIRKEKLYDTRNFDLRRRCHECDSPFMELLLTTTLVYRAPNRGS